MGSHARVSQFSIARRAVSATDLSARPAWTARRLADLLVLYEWVAPAALRRRALVHGLGRIVYEQRQSRHQALSPVNGLLNCLALWAHDPAHPDLEPSLAGVEAWRWEDREEGVRYAGARSHTWDTAFSAQALLERTRRRRGAGRAAAAPTASSGPPSSRRSCPTPGPSSGIRSGAAGASPTERTAGP